jgi:glycosyltransferase involved in cell wall biosynthesis
MYRDKKIGVVVLAYNVEEHIAAVLETMPPYVDAVYVVNDGSSDSTTDIVRAFAVHESRVSLLSHAVNRGPGAALTTGYGRAFADGMDIVVKIDGDNQMPLDEMANLVDPLVSGSADYAKGNRLVDAKHRETMPRFRLVGNLMLTWLTRVASGNWHVSDPQNGYVAISHGALSITGWDLYPYYGYLNHMLVRLQVHNLVVADVPMVARYGCEKSAIRLHRYVPKVSGLMMRLFLWRMTHRFRVVDRPVEVSPIGPTAHCGLTKARNPSS